MSNNIYRRLPNLLQRLKSARPDIVCLQELKSTEANFGTKGTYGPQTFPLADLLRPQKIQPASMKNGEFL
jgi:endonuclease/exonuclease/phosphatase family metal-dependent hydrolase